MKISTVFVLTCSLAISSLALAESGGDRTFDRMMKARDVAVQAYNESAATANTRDVAQQESKVSKPHG
ncbi:hypothetical protein L6228_15010 [Pseudomonas syringae pv. syringae]|uniref:co-regulatory protein PtrA N-terminal domain-containing protein n=1 Tax=Pseudomonas syringae TaxID=317 RepID=UPI001F0DC5C0|nr:co-regulatory protein PtrA N-terminal domain-containing protein [Pseudomonas syringae]MCH5633811.1 hypothetical protein [Pseudomonas syringae pv. syringae]MCH5663037.1 hypothetical protein [Pseudomonas syringae pv. syringae]